MTSSIGNLNAFSYENVAQTNNNFNKLYVPVNKSALLYSHFEHVSGVAAKAGQQGVSISKLSILNTMIERVSEIKNQKAPKLQSLENLSENDVNSLIRSFQKEIQNAVKNPYIISGAKPLPGNLISFSI